MFAVAASLPLLARSQHELMRWFSIAALTLLAICYLGILLAPHLSIHLATDRRSRVWPATGAVRSATRTCAAGIMAMLLFFGIYFIRAGGWIAGVTVIGLASLFLLYSAGKSSLTLCFAVLLLTSLTSVVRSFWAARRHDAAPLLLLNMLSIGTVMSETLAQIASLLPLDASFTGRTDIWSFALQSLQPRLATGYGYASFWGSSAIQNLPEGKEWAAYASHSHNGYLDTALAMGLPGLALLIGAIVITPLRDFQSADRGGNNGPLAMVFLRIWLFGLYLSSMESFFLDRADPMWVTFLIAVFGLHYLARFRARANMSAHPDLVRSFQLAPRDDGGYRFRDIPPPPRRNRTAAAPVAFDRRHDAVGIGLARRSARHQHDGAAIDQRLEARMVIELVRQGRAGDDQRPA